MKQSPVGRDDCGTASGPEPEVGENEQTWAGKGGGGGADSGKVGATAVTEKKEGRAPISDRKANLRIMRSNYIRATRHHTHSPHWFQTDASERDPSIRYEKTELFSL